MFACLIIALELVILYTVFSYIFLHEPRPYRITGDPWGRYEVNPAKPLPVTEYETALSPGNYQQQEYASARSFPPAWQDNQERVAYFNSTDAAQTLPSARLSEMPANGNPGYGWVMAEQPRHPAMIAKALDSFLRTLDDLGAKLPE